MSFIYGLEKNKSILDWQDEETHPKMDAEISVLIPQIWFCDNIGIEVGELHRRL